MLVCLAGCLAAPPPQAADLGDPDGSDGGASPPDAVVSRCVSGSSLDLVHVSRISLIPAFSPSLAGFAVFVNPGIDTVVIPGFSVSVVGADPRVIASASLSGGEAGLSLSPGEAKGALSEAASSVVLAAFSENWVDAAQPGLAAGFDIVEQEFEVEPPIAVSLLVTAGEFEFSPTISLELEASQPSGTPLAAARVTAFCP